MVNDHKCCASCLKSLNLIEFLVNKRYSKLCLNCRKIRTKTKQKIYKKAYQMKNLDKYRQSITKFYNKNHKKISFIKRRTDSLSSNELESLQNIYIYDNIREIVKDDKGLIDP